MLEQPTGGTTRRAIFFSAPLYLEGSEHTDDQNIREVERYLLGKQSASPVADGAALASRFGQEDLDPMVTYDQKQREFVLAFGEFHSKALQFDRGVLEFRSDILGGSENTISYEEADGLVRSPAARILSIDSFNEAGIPLIGHTAEFVRRKDNSRYLRVEASGKTATFRSGGPEVRFPFRWFTREGHFTSPLLVDKFSILGRLGRLAEALTKHHPIAAEEAAYFVLCGGTLHPRSISGRVDNKPFVYAGAYGYNHSTITLTVGPWMSPEQVRQAYAKLRRQATANNTYRSKSDKNIAVFRFVVERAALIVPKDMVIGTHRVFRFPPWRRLVDEWNKQFPHDHRKRFDQPGYTAEKMFRNAFTAGYRAVTGLKYYAPKPVTSKQPLDNIVRKLKSRT